MGLLSEEGGRGWRREPGGRGGAEGWNQPWENSQGQGQLGCMGKDGGDWRRAEG